MGYEGENSVHLPAARLAQLAVCLACKQRVPEINPEYREVLFSPVSNVLVPGTILRSFPIVPLRLVSPVYCTMFVTLCYFV